MGLGWFLYVATLECEGTFDMGMDMVRVQCWFGHSEHCMVAVPLSAILSRLQNQN